MYLSPWSFIFYLSCLAPFVMIDIVRNEYEIIRQILRRLQDNDTFLTFYHFFVICSTSLDESVYLFFSFLSIETQHTLNRLTIVYFHCNSAISVPSFKCSKNHLKYIYYTIPVAKLLLLYFSLFSFFSSFF